MKFKVGQRSAVGLALATALVASVGLWVSWLGRASGRDPLWEESFYAVTIAVYILLGTRLISQHNKNDPGRRIAWILLWGAFLGSLLIASNYASYAFLVARPAQERAGQLTAWAGDAVLQLGLAGLLPPLAILYPNGRYPPSRSRTSNTRWRFVLWLVRIDVLVLLIGVLLEPKLVAFPTLVAPLARLGLGRVARVSTVIGVILAFVNLSAAIWSLRVRARFARLRNDSRTRLKIRWIGYIAAIAPIVVLGLLSPAIRHSGPLVIKVGSVALTLIFAGCLWAAMREWDWPFLNDLYAKTLMYSYILMVIVGGQEIGVHFAGELAGHVIRPNSLLFLVVLAFVAIVSEVSRQPIEQWIRSGLHISENPARARPITPAFGTPLGGSSEGEPLQDG